MNIYAIDDFGAVGDGVADDTAKVQDAIDAAAATGGIVFGTKGSIYRCTVAPIVLDNVALDLAGATLLLDLSQTNDTGVRLRSHAELRNGTVEVRSSGTPSLQAGVHAAVTIGPIYGDGGTVGEESDDEGVAGWTVRNMVLSTDKNADMGGGAFIGGAAISVIGGASNGLIEQIVVPDSGRMVGAVHLDWGFVGSIASADVPGSRENFDNDEGYTSHPHNIVIRDIAVGALTRTLHNLDTGSFGVRLSGVYNVIVENVRVACATNAAFLHTAGDLGFEFALDDVKPSASKGIEFRDCTVADNATGYLVHCDSYADNIGRAVVEEDYEPLLDPIQPTDIRFERINGRAGGGSDANYGIRIRQQRGGVVEDCSAAGYKQGFNVDELVFGFSLIRPRAAFNREHGISIEHPSRKPEDIRVEAPVAHDNGQDAGFSNPCGLYIDGSFRVTVRDGVFGREGENDPTQRIGLRVNENAVDTVIENCRVRSAKASTGLGYAILSNSDYGKLGLFSGNSADSPLVSTPYGGVSIVPVERRLTTDGRPMFDHVAQRGTLSSDITPTAGTWNRGDRIFYSDPSAGGNLGSICTTGGAIGSGAVFKPIAGIGA